MTGQTDKKTRKASAQRSEDPQGLPRGLPRGPTGLHLVLGGVSAVRPPIHRVEYAEVYELPRRVVITTLVARRGAHLVVS